MVLIKTTDPSRRPRTLAGIVHQEEVDSVKAYLSLKEAAEHLGVEYKTVWRLVNQGKLPAGKVMGVWRISAADLDAFFEQQKELALKTAADRCAVCGKPMMSALSIGGRCQVCEAPICRSCWSLEGRRFCSLHQPEEAAATVETTPLRCGRCGQVIPSLEMAGGRCEAPGCEALLCVNCWRGPDGHLCSRHVTTAGEKLEEARARLARGEIDRLVTSVKAKTREINFIARFDQKVRQVATLRDPVTGRALRIADWGRCHVTEDDTASLLEVLGVGYLDKAFLARIPLNLRSRYEVSASGEQSSLVMEAIAISRLEAHARDGFDAAPATLSDLLPYLQERAEQAESIKVTYVLGIAATSGWDQEATGYINADTRGRSYSHRLLLPYLVDLHTGEMIYNTLDERLTSLADLFSPQLFGEEVQTVVDYVRQTMLTSGLSSLTASQVTKALAVGPEVVREALQQLSSDGEFTMEEISGLGLVIARS